MLTVPLCKMTSSYAHHCTLGSSGSFESARPDRTKDIESEKESKAKEPRGRPKFPVVVANHQLAPGKTHGTRAFVDGRYKVAMMMISARPLRQGIRGIGEQRALQKLKASLGSR